MNVKSILQHLKRKNSVQNMENPNPEHIVTEQKTRSVTEHGASLTVTLPPDFKTHYKERVGKSLILTTYKNPKTGEKYLVVGIGESEYELIKKEIEKEKKP